MKTTVSKGTRMTVEEYDNIKLLTGTELSKTLIAKLSKRSPATISMIKESKDWNNYREITNSHVQKIYDRKAQKEALAQSKVAEVLQEETPKVEPVTELKNGVDVPVVNDTLVTAIHNLTEAVITMSAVMDKMAKSNVAEQSKSFFKR